MNELCLETSAVVAISFDEATAPELKREIEGADRLYIGAATLFEAILVISRRTGVDAEERLLALMRGLNVEIVPFDADQLRFAQSAYVRYGKGRHPAALNFGDCLSYAAAKASGARLLYVGDDFAQTDLT